MLAWLVVPLEVGALATLAGRQMHDVATLSATGHDVDTGLRMLDLVAALLKELEPAKLAGNGYTLHCLPPH